MKAKASSSSLLQAMDASRQADNGDLVEFSIDFAERLIGFFEEISPGPCQI